MNRSLGLLILLLFIAAGCACPLGAPSTTPTPGHEPLQTVSPEYAEPLASRFCPIIYLNGEAEAAENFEPEQIGIMVDEAFLLDVEDPSFLEKATLPGLLQWSRSVYYLDLLELGPTTHSSAQYKLNYDAVKDRYQPSVYARVREAADTGYTVVQYWIFYYFNDWRNCHEGDWELVQLCFPALTAQELLDRGEQPVFAAYSQHQAGQRMSWDSMKNSALVVGTHPVVYVARGSHANYFAPGNYWSGLDFDITGSSSWTVIEPEQLNIVLLPEIGTEDEELGWLEFKGGWGEYLGFSVSVLDLKFWQSGPFGPPWSEGEQASDRWAHPDEWAAELPEYPDPFWTYFLDLAGDWLNRAFFCLFSPADIHVYDSLGRHVGVNEQGEIDKQIPGAEYITPQGTQYKTIVIPYADISQEYTVIVVGTGSGTMELKMQVPDATDGVRRYFEYTNVPVSPTTIARVSIMPDMIPQLELDSDGDGAFELRSAPGKFEESKVLAPQVDITSPEDGTTVGVRLINVEGTVVSENEIEEATVTYDGTSRALDLTFEGEGSYHHSFSTPIELHQGWNTITVTATDTRARSGSDSININANIPVNAIRIELTWNTDYDDLDSHLIMPGGVYGDAFADCNWNNMNPDWGISGYGPDDPSLDFDDVEGYGPEHVVLEEAPYDGIYEFKVHYYDDDGYPGPTTARVRIWINDELAFEASQTLYQEDQVWDCACIVWDSATGIGDAYAGPCQ